LSDEAKDLGDSGRNLRQLISSLEISEGDFIELSSKDGAELVRVNIDLVKHARRLRLMVPIKLLMRLQNCNEKLSIGSCCLTPSMSPY
jgi:hypothetical protein